MAQAQFSFLSSGEMYLNICHHAVKKRLTRLFLNNGRWRVMKTISSNSTMSPLMRSDPKFAGFALWERADQHNRGGRPSDSIRFMLCIFFSHPPLFHKHFSSGQQFTYLSELIVVWHPFNFCGPSRWRRRMGANVAYSAACDFGRWEICWGSAD